LFADPFVTLYNAVSTSLPRVGIGPSSSMYSTLDQTLKATISHAIGKRARHSLRLDFQKIAADPLQPATNKPFTGSVYLVADVPLAGFSIAEQKLYVDALTYWATFSSGASITKFLGGES